MVAYHFHEKHIIGMLCGLISTILLKKTTAAQNEDALGYYRVRGLYFQAVVFVATIIGFLFLFRIKFLA